MTNIARVAALAFFIALAGSLAWGQESVEVKEVPPGIIQELKRADAEVEIANKALAAAQNAALAAKRIRVEIEERAASDLRPFEGECKTRYPESGGNTVHAVIYLPTRSFRRVTITGKFLMVHAGTEQCNNGSIWTTNNAIGVAHD